MWETVFISILVVGAGGYLLWNFTRGKPSCHSGCEQCKECSMHAADSLQEIRARKTQCSNTPLAENLKKTEEQENRISASDAHK